MRKVDLFDVENSVVTGAFSKVSITTLLANLLEKEEDSFDKEIYFDTIQDINTFFNELEKFKASKRKIMRDLDRKIESLQLELQQFRDCRAGSLTGGELRNAIFKMKREDNYIRLKSAINELNKEKSRYQTIDREFKSVLAQVEENMRVLSEKLDGEAYVYETVKDNRGIIITPTNTIVVKGWDSMTNRPNAMSIMYDGLLDTQVAVNVIKTRMIDNLSKR